MMNFREVGFKILNMHLCCALLLNRISACRTLLRLAFRIYYFPPRELICFVRHMIIVYCKQSRINGTSINFAMITAE